MEDVEANQIVAVAGTWKEMLHLQEQNQLSKAHREKTN